MSVTKRVSEDAEDYVCNNMRDGENWVDALDRLLGLSDEPLTEERVEEIVEEKIEEMRYRN